MPGVPAIARDRADIIKLTERFVPRPRPAGAQTGGAVVLAFPKVERPLPKPLPRATVWDRLRGLVDRAEQTSRDRRRRARERAIRRARHRELPPTVRRQV